MAKWIYNNTETTQTWCSQEIASNTYYQVQPAEEVRWANDDSVLSSIANSDIIISTSNSAPGHITAINSAILHIKDSLPVDIQTANPFALSTYYEVRATGFSGTAESGQTTAIDLLLHATEDRYINGSKLILKNHSVNDTVNLKVVDVTGNIAFPGCPANTVLKQFAYNWNVDETTSDQGGMYYNFLARVPAGIYIRLEYTSTGESDVTVRINMSLFKKVE